MGSTNRPLFHRGDSGSPQFCVKVRHPSHSSQTPWSGTGNRINDKGRANGLPKSSPVEVVTVLGTGVLLVPTVVDGTRGTGDDTGVPTLDEVAFSFLIHYTSPLSIFHSVGQIETLCQKGEVKGLGTEELDGLLKTGVD